jgi:hypothetical protein
MADYRPTGPSSTIPRGVMNTVSDPSGLCARFVFERDEIDRLRWFQMNRYFEGGLLDERPRTLTDDPSLGRSTYFGVYRGNEIQATARIIRATTGLPMLKHHAVYPSVQDELDAARGTVAEISRFAVCSSTPYFRAGALLGREILRFGWQNQHATILIASVEKPFVRILNRQLGVPLQIIGPPIEQYGAFKGECVPIKIDTVECLDNFRRQASRRWQFFMEGLVIDLSAPQPTVGATLSQIRLGQDAS